MLLRKETELQKLGGKGMNKVHKVKETTRTADMLKEAMDAQNLSIRDVAMKAGVSYEHIRNILAPGSKIIPSPLLIAELARILKLDKMELRRAGVVDNIQKKYGSIPAELSGKNPELDPIERAWPKLTDEHKTDVIAMVQMFAKRDSGD